MHSNGEIIKQTYDAFGRGDMPTVFGILDKEIKWHVPGQSPLSGDYRGHDEVMGFFKKCMDLSPEYSLALRTNWLASHILEKFWCWILPRVA
jgi:ketosteroid isomerase-like protein